MLRKSLSLNKSFLAVLTTVLLFIFGEGLIIMSTAKIGVLYTTAVFSLASIPICLFIRNTYESHLEGRNILRRVDSWARKKENEINPSWYKIAETSKTFAWVVSGLISGVFITTIFIELLGYRGRAAMVRIIATNLVFYFVWASIYNGSIKILHYVI